MPNTETTQPTLAVSGPVAVTHGRGECAVEAVIAGARGGGAVGVERLGGVGRAVEVNAGPRQDIPAGGHVAEPKLALCCRVLMSI